MKHNANKDRPGDAANCAVSSVAINAHAPLVDTNRPLVVAQAGLTLIELMAVLVVAAILLGVAIPAIGDFIRNSRMITQANELVADLALARSEAVKRATTITVCKSADPTAASPTCETAGANWAIGRVVFIDKSSPANDQVDSDDVVLRVREALSGNGSLNSGTNVRNRVVFTRLGLTTLGVPADSANPVENRLVLCDERGPSYGRSITIEVTGRATVARNPASCAP
jgi:type IV fimbrial biogenesis protein FimT